MSHIKKYAPRRRFEKFSNADDWEQRKLGDHAKYRRGSFPQPYGNKEWYDGEGAMPFVQVVDVTSKLTLVENTKQKISKLAQPKSVFVPKGKVIVTLQGSIGRVAITQYDSFVDRTLLIFDDYEKETDERFWAYTIQKKFEIEKLKAPGGTIKTITKEALSSFDVHLPQFEEQQKIGILFKQLGDTIALHQRKLEKIKALKTAYLSEMFPAEGETKPKRRFGGFTDDWEQRKFSQVADIFDGTHQTPKYTDFGVKFVSVENITTMETKKYISQEAYDKEYSNKKVEQGDVLMTRIGDVGTAKVIETDEPLAYYVTLALLKPKGIDPDFLAQQIASPEVQRSIWKRTLHIAFPKKINLGEINQVSIFIPDLEEQAEIGIFFKQLDKTITLHQRKLQKLQNIKKAYLNEMFI
ncbi:restriction endonuclease subunit S [Listeria monocytogenes]|uniref:restriction endonuclease subunit S n=1 Tax=Listeria monocytogenes TaxID=1639 RepID=UPI000875135E|nr:restriction endonuclease subunit S [Listeria monocytogenes]EAD1463460.1 restriction endonuclease subunit S [Listeria monocytogenes]EAD2777481.1 restriction endonuclease subunit S [Listeria monocytogenes]EAE1475408.1 restriction endonuclease subunit S [Listeria monocytogenes]EAG3550506.1 restriction endonuclease subunit S [Listeria monocytogenes]EBH4332506.1 restriction endonuclease subunit S [Listeria monocytogenes]